MSNETLDTRLLFSNGESISLLEDLNIKTLGFIPGDPQIESEKIKLQGSYGIHYTSSAYTEFPATLRILVECNDTAGVQSKMMQLRALFARLTDYYLMYSDIPGIRWPVRYEGLQENRKPGQVKFECTVSFNVYTGYAESLYKTDSPKTWDAGTLQWGMGVEWDDDFEYIFKSKNFTFKNIGTIEINPAQHDITWKIKCDPRYIKITNFTTNDSLTIYNPGAAAEGIVLIKGLHIEDEYGRNLVRFADAGEIHIAPGINQIKIETTAFKWCEIVTRFYYA
ncbi:phage tail family protein [Bacillus cereus]|nr:phage tail family protein [Bacillus cereus]